MPFLSVCAGQRRRQKKTLLIEMCWSVGRVKAEEGFLVLQALSYGVFDRAERSVPNRSCAPRDRETGSRYACAGYVEFHLKDLGQEATCLWI